MEDPDPEIADAARVSFRHISFLKGRYSGYRPSRSHCFETIGDGHVGEKGRGLFFVAEHLDEMDPIPGLRLSVPRTAVLTTSDYEDLLGRCGLDGSREDLRSDTVLQAFLEHPLPAAVERQLANLVDLPQPLIVRSSSLLEGTLRHSLAGQYRSVFVPPAARERRRRLLLKAVRTVQASVWTPEAREYRAKTLLEASEERMAVLVQPVIGRAVGDAYYPFASGIAASHNAFPWTREIAADRDAALYRIVFGLGTRAVAREPACMFSPGYPGLIDMLRGPEDLDLTQRKCAFIDLGTGELGSAEISTMVGMDDEIGLAAQRFVDGHLKALSAQPDSAATSAVVTFKPLLTSGALGRNGEALQEAVGRLKSLFEFDIAIEFALTRNPPSTTAAPEEFTLDVLQVRPAESDESNRIVAWTRPADERLLVETSAALGNTHLRNILYLVYVPRTTVESDPGGQRARAAIKELNFKLGDLGFVLVGSGWWGTTLPGRGVPVTYDEVSRAKAIVEVLNEFTPHPSFGGHLISNLRGTGTPLLSVTSNDLFKRDWFETEHACHEVGDIKVIEVPQGLGVAVDGRSRKGIIYLQ
jgi:hypothetical protein